MWWDPSTHSNDENVRWSWLRAVEWASWPVFISQPIVPALLYFYDWSVIFVGVVLALAAFLWRALVVPSWVAPRLAQVGVFFVQLRFITSPAMAYLIGIEATGWEPRRRLCGRCWGR